MIKYFSTFSGIGGFELGIGKKGKCVGFSEVNKYAIQVYQSHFPKHKNYGDITKIAAESIPDFDLLCGGFPCQAFSIAGKRGGFDDTRGTLFFDLARIARVKRPRLLFFENVKGLLSHDRGRTFETIIRTLDELGYDCQWQVLNSKNFGVPQNRERVFIIGHLRGTGRPQVFPFRKDDGSVTERFAQGVQQITSTLKAKDYSSWRGNFLRVSNSQDGVIHTPDQISQTLSAGHYNQPKILQLNHPKHSQYRLYGVEGIAPSLTTMQGGNLQPKIVTRTPLKFLKRNQKNIEGDYSFTVDTANTSGVSVDGNVRRLTPLECERLQGFPDNWTDCVSDSQRYKCCGNAVTVNVIKAIADELLANN